MQKEYIIKIYTIFSEKIMEMKDCKSFDIIFYFTALSLKFLSYLFFYCISCCERPFYDLILRPLLRNSDFVLYSLIGVDEIHHNLLTPVSTVEKIGVFKLRNLPEMSPAFYCISKDFSLRVSSHLKEHSFIYIIIAAQLDSVYPVRNIHKKNNSIFCFRLQFSYMKRAHILRPKWCRKVRL